jgi:hypothetical protein
MLAVEFVTLLRASTLQSMFLKCIEAQETAASSIAAITL